MLQDAAALAPPPTLTPRQAEVPVGGHGVRAVSETPQGDVDGVSQDTLGQTI